MKKNITLIAIIFLSNYSTLIAQGPTFSWTRKVTNSGIIPGGIAIDTIRHFLYATGVCGSIVDFGQGQIVTSDNNVFLAKYDLAGTLIWTKIFTQDDPIAAKGIAVDFFGNVFITGNSECATTTFGAKSISNSHPKSKDYTVAYLCKLNSDGIPLWLKGSTGGDGLGSNAVAVDKEGNAFITGYEVYPQGNGTFEGFAITSGGAFFMKFNKDGVGQWFKETKGNGPLLTASGDLLAIDRDGNCIAAGTYFTAYANFGSIVLPNEAVNSNWGFVTKINSTNGEFSWALGSGIPEGQCKYTGLTMGFDKKIYLSGARSVYANVGSTDTEYKQFLEEVNTYGVSQRAEYFKTQSLSSNFYLASNKKAEIFMSVNIFNDTIQYGNEFLSSRGYNQIMGFVKADSSGKVLNSIANSNTSIGNLVNCYGIAADSSGNVYMIGTLSGTNIFGNTSITANSDMVIVKIAGGKTPTGLQEKTEKNGFLIYPNPVSDVLTIVLNSQIKPSKVEVYNALGEIVLSAQNQSTLDVSELLTGIYTVKIKTEEKYFSQRMIKQ